MKEIQEHKIKIYEFPDTEDDEDNKLIRKIKASDHKVGVKLDEMTSNWTDSQRGGYLYPSPPCPAASLHNSSADLETSTLNSSDRRLWFVLMWCDLATIITRCAAHVHALPQASVICIQ